MVYTFPMPLDVFFDGLPIQSFVADLGEAMEHNRTGGGEIVSADLGPRLMKLDCVIRKGDYVEIERVMAKLDVLRYAGRSLIVHAMPITAPQYDPDGSILGVSAITLTDVAVNNRVIELSGFPEGYKLQYGDFLSFTYGSNPIRYAIHKVVNEAEADEDGVMAGLEVVDFIRPGFALDTAVTLIKPRFKAVLVPGSTEKGSSGSMFTDGIKFSLIQTLR